MDNWTCLTSSHYACGQNLDAKTWLSEVGPSLQCGEAGVLTELQGRACFRLATVFIALWPDSDGELTAQHSIA